MAKEKPAPSSEEKARFIITCWMSVLAADGNIEKEELGLLKSLATRCEELRQFKEEWVEDACYQALKVVSKVGITNLMKSIGESVKKFDDQTRTAVLRSCLEMACVDEHFSTEEILAVKRIVKAMHMGRDQLLTDTLYFLKEQIHEGGLRNG